MKKPVPVNNMQEVDTVRLSCHDQGFKDSEAGDGHDQDPRNWSSTRKTLLFIALMSSSLLADGYVLPTLLGLP